MRNEIIFEVTESLDGGFEAKALGYSIYTQCDEYDDLEMTLREAVECHFEEENKPKIIRIHFIKDEVFAV